MSFKSSTLSDAIFSYPSLVWPEKGRYVPARSSSASNVWVAWRKNPFSPWIDAGKGCSTLAGNRNFDVRTAQAIAKAPVYTGCTYWLTYWGTFEWMPSARKSSDVVSDEPSVISPQVNSQIVKPHKCVQPSPVNHFYLSIQVCMSTPNLKFLQIMNQPDQIDKTFR